MVKISIIILVKNGGAHLEEALERVFSQKVECEFEVVAIDSGSRDNSKEILGRFPVRVQEISPAAFNHGETRNLGASLAEGSYLVYLTQDAIPWDDHWLERLVEPLQEDPMVAGAFSSHRPRKDCPLMEKRQILETELTSGKMKRVNVAIGNPAYERSPYPFIWFSNTSSCIRKTVWESGLSGDSTLQRIRSGPKEFWRQDTRPFTSLTLLSSTLITTNQSGIFDGTSNMRGP